MTQLKKGFGPADAWNPFDSITCGRMIGATCESVCVRRKVVLGKDSHAPHFPLPPAPCYLFYSCLALGLKSVEIASFN